MYCSVDASTPAVPRESGRIPLPTVTAASADFDLESAKILALTARAVPRRAQGARTGGACEIGEVVDLRLVQPQRAGERVEHLGGDSGEVACSIIA